MNISYRLLFSITTVTTNLKTKNNTKCQL